MGAAGSIQAQANQGAIPEKLDEAQCKAYCVEWGDEEATKFKDNAVEGFVTKELFLDAINKSKNFYDEEKIKNHLKTLEGAPWKDPEYFKGLGAKFTKIAAKHPNMVQADDWKASMVREILAILECGPEIEKTLADQEMLDDGDILLGTQDRESLWEIFDSSEARMYVSRYLEPTA